jgi:hypothetical protein
MVISLKESGYILQCHSSDSALLSRSSKAHVDKSLIRGAWTRPGGLAKRLCTRSSPNPSQGDKPCRHFNRRIRYNDLVVSMEILKPIIRVLTEPRDAGEVQGHLVRRHVTC